MKSALFIFIVCILLVVLSGCHEEKYFKFKSEDLIVNVGEEFELEVETNIVDYSTFKFSYNSDEVIEKITEFSFKALEKGEVLISVYINDAVYDSIKIYVKEIKSIEFNSDVINIKNYENIPIELKLTEIEKTEDISFSFSEEGIITIENNYIKPLMVGSVTLTAYLKSDPNVCAMVIVNVEEKKEIYFSIDLINIKEKEIKTIPINLKGLTLNLVNFKVDNEGIIKIDGDKIIGLKEGIVKLSASCIEDEGIEDTMTLIVEKTYDINDPNYWIHTLSKNYDSNEELLTTEEIKVYNQNVYNNTSLTNVVDILSQPDELSGSTINGLIQSYNSINKYIIYNNSRQVTQLEKDEILNNRNLTNIPTNVNVQYGIVTEFCAVRTYPTLSYASTENRDMFQETSLNVGEGVLIYHKSSDNLWYFIQAMNYYGWVEASKIGMCSKEQLINFLKPINFIVILEDKISINNTIIRMGQTLPLLSENESEFVVNYPTNNHGILEIKSGTVIKNNASIGYLKYTTANVFKQAFKLLGIPYSWGDKIIDGRDCSSTQNSIYACFGFMMPRNTSDQSEIPGYSNNVSTITINAEYLKTNLRPGSLIFSKGHVLMYIGEDELGNAFVFHNTSSGTPGCRIQSFNTYTTQIIATLKLY